MGFYDNGGMVGKVPNYYSNDYQNIPASASYRKLEYVGGTSGAILASVSTTTAVSLTNLTGGIDSFTYENDMVLLSYVFAGYPIYIPANWSTLNTTTSDSVAATHFSISPANNTQSVAFVNAVSSNITGSTATTTDVNLPAGLSTGDVVIVSYGIGSTVSRTAQFNLNAQGYANISIQTSSDTFDANLGVFYKVMGATPDTIVTIPATGAVADAGAVVIQAFRYANTSTPIGLDIPSTGGTAISTRRVSGWGSYTPSYIGARGVMCAAAAFNDAAETGFTTTDSLENFITFNNSSTTNDVLIGMAHQLFDANLAVSTTSSIVNAVTISGYTNITRQWAWGAGAEPPYVAGHSTQYKIMGSTPDTSITLPAPGTTAFTGAYAVQVWRGIDTSTPLDVTPVQYVQAAGRGNTVNFSETGTRRPDPQAITPVTANAEIIAIGATATGTGSLYTNSGLNNFLTAFSDDSVDSIIGMYSNTWVSGSYDPTAFTTAADIGTAGASSLTLALRPTLRVGSEYSNYKKLNSGMWNNSARFNAKKNVSTGYARVVSYTGFATSPYVSGVDNLLQITLPKDIIPNDLILIVAGSDAETSSPIFNNTTYKPTGFTFISTALAGDGTTRNGAHVAAFYKVANGTESNTTASINLAGTSRAGYWIAAYVIRDALISSPIGVIGSGNDTNSTDLRVPGIVTSDFNSLVFCVQSHDSVNDLSASISSLNDVWLEENTNIGGGTATSTAGGVIAYRQMQYAQQSSYTVTVRLYSAPAHQAGFQFEIKSVN